MSKNYLSNKLYKMLRNKFNYLEESKIKKYVEYSNLALDELKDKSSSLKEKAFFSKFYLD